MNQADKKDQLAQALPWFTNKPVDILQYRVNRRALPQLSLLGTQPDSFVDHLAEVLLFGHPVTVARRGERTWQLGNRDINSDNSTISGVIGWQSKESREGDYFNRESAEWESRVEQTNRAVTAPFSIATDQRRLLVVKHRSYAETTLATVFRSILNDGENERPIGPTTSWDVEPILDDIEFFDWLQTIAVLSKISFDVKLPNPDAEETFEEIHQYLIDMQASQMQHTLMPSDPDVGLSTDLNSHRLTSGLIEMAKRGFASISASALDSSANIRRFTQKNRTLRQTRTLMSKTYNAARDELASYISSIMGEEDG